MRVYIDKRKYITVYDGSVPRGVVGAITYRASADYDNVVVSQAPHTSIFVSDFAGQIMLRYVLDGRGPYEIDRVPYPVTPGTWYTIRYENLFWESRVYVNDQLVIQSYATRGKKGKVGLMTYRAAAEFDDFRAYQP